MDRSIRAGVSGFFLAVIINLFLPVSLYFFAFIPSFLAAIMTIYIHRLETLKDGLVAAFMTYIFNQGILDTIALLDLYLTNTQYALTVDIWLVLYPIANAVTAMIAGYIGIWLVHKMKPAHELPRPPPLPPPMQPV
jgi:hypothetical protein